MNILIFNCNPKKESFCSELAKKYYEGAINSEFDAELINLNEINFELSLHDGYTNNLKIEDDLKNIQQKIKIASHIVFVFPNWWGTYPALLKGFIDKTFVPGFAFKYKKGSLKWEKLLTGKTARLIITMDTPKLYYRLYYRSPGVNSLKKSVLEFCGINPVKITIFSPVKLSNDKQRKKWLEKVMLLGEKGK